MALPHITRSDFDADLEEFAKNPDVKEELAAALQLLEKLRPLEDLSIRTIIVGENHATLEFGFEFCNEMGMNKVVGWLVL